MPTLSATVPTLLRPHSLFWAWLQMASPLQRVTLLRVRPDKAKAEVAVAIRGHADAARRNASVQRRAAPRAATDNPVRAGRWTHRVRY